MAKLREDEWRGTETSMRFGMENMDIDAQFGETEAEGDNVCAQRHTASSVAEVGHTTLLTMVRHLIFLPDLVLFLSILFYSRLPG